jgi:hypothetical protein
MEQFDSVPIFTEPVAVPRAVLVLGSYRSGLAAMTGVIHRLGADIPINDASLAKVHDDVASAGSTGWSDWRAVDRTLRSAPDAARLQQQALDAMQMNFATSRLFVLRDPRICRSLPFWRAAVAAFGARALAVVMVRHPLKVIDSLSRRYECAPATSCLLWLRYMLDAEHASRDLPRTIVTYDALLSDWPDTISRLQTGLALHWPRRSAAVDLEIERFLKEPVRRDADRTELASEAQDWLFGTYNALAQLSLDPFCMESRVRLDMIRSELDRAFAIFRHFLRSPEEELNETVWRLYVEIEDSDLFDRHWYLQSYPDVRNSQLDPLLHYLKYGISEARNPNPFFDTVWYLEQNLDVTADGVHPLAHFLSYGAAEGRDPSPRFDTDWYRQQYPEVAGANPLAHYLKRGRLQNLRPKPPGG